MSSYYKKDYVSFHRLATMIWTTIGYAMVAGLIGIAYMDQVLEELTLGKSNYFSSSDFDNLCDCVSRILDSERAVFIRKKHSEARTRVKKYSHNLLVLNKLYEKENM